MSEYESKDEASFGQPEEVDLSDGDSDDSFKVFFSVLVTERRQMKLTMSSTKL